ncbi:Methyltransferase domain-containing protein [Kaistia soli DSM 19436]|uniref:Methyltransferase domain-containing protein n=1 Tax=Kaistia soli DSM 19436 TaxID=1122133 RepID=A0A1M5N8J7_9HYPH|nr:class I SAM-dependent methyltransferase [Kaistia soli]SHG85795.1 Methyltransferase domain-containing protein [Kaistia soli DSM 19436]
MAQNIYDQSAFFEGYSKLSRSVEGLDGATEWPAMRAMLPPLAGLDIVDLGCGYGWFCRFAASEAPRSVLGIDLSERMLDRARAMGGDPRIRYQRGDLDTLELPASSFDLVYSSLALHYVEDAARLLGAVHQGLKPGGRFVFSTEHPIYMAPSQPAFTIDGEGRRIWPVDRYLIEGPRTTNWLADGVVKHHRTLGTTLNLLIATGFRIDHVEEFCPTEVQIAAYPELEEERDRPMFLLIAASR